MNAATWARYWSGDMPGLEVCGWLLLILLALEGLRRMTD